MVVITVADSGWPIPRKSAQDVPAFLHDEEVGKGTGMGLSISQGIVANMAVRSRWMNACTSSCSGLAVKGTLLLFALTGSTPQYAR